MKICARFCPLLSPRALLCSSRYVILCGKEGPTQWEDSLSPGRRRGRSPHGMRLQPEMW